MWFPSFKLFGLFGTGSIYASRFFEGGTLSWLIFPSVQWPIINLGRIKANVQQKNPHIGTAVLTYSKTVIEAFKEVEDFLIATIKHAMKCVLHATDYRAYKQTPSLLSLYT